MTAYLIAYEGFSSAGTPPPVIFDILPVTYPVRIAKIDVFAFGSTGIFIYSYSGAGLSGGTTVTPFPLRGGVASPACTAIVKTGATISGTQTLVDVMWAGTNGISQGPYGAVTTYQQGSNTFQAGYDLIIPIGSALRVQFSTSTNIAVSESIYFEEVRPFLSF